ncbi:MAG: HAD family hydrolase [Candidatus Thorarchaeota archaeon]
MTGVSVNGEVINCRLVLFDLDGTLVDKEYRNTALAKTRYNAITRLVGAKAAQRWAQYSGVDLDTFKVDENGPLSKAPRKEDVIVATTAIWLNGLNWFEAKELAIRAYAAADVEQNRSFKSRLIHRAQEALREMRRAGLLLGIATNGSGKMAREIMALNGVEELFDVFTGADEVAEGKPEPDMILEACRRAGVDPGEAVYVGDELVDAIAGKAAGVAGVIIVKRGSDISAYTRYVLDSVVYLKAV